MRKLLAGWMVVPALVVMGGCASTSSSLATSAERLERSTYELERDADESRVREDARELYEQTRDFRRALADRRADRDDIRDAFSDVSRSYHSLRDEVERSRDDDAERDFEAVTSAYLDIEREVGRRDSYARD